MLTLSEVRTEMFEFRKIEKLLFEFTIYIVRVSLPLEVITENCIKSVWIENKTGINTQLWGQPLLLLTISDLCLPTVTNCFLSTRKYEVKLIREFGHV